MTIRRARYGRIEKLVDGIINRFAIVAPAVPVGRILTASGIEVRSGDLGNVSGLIARRGRYAIIGVNVSQARVRQRFTMAHEYGHYVLHEDIAEHTDTVFKVNYRDRVSAEASDVDEIEANFFAACLLMPRRFLDELDADQYIDDDDGVAYLANCFDVSRHAMSLRLANLYDHYSPY